MHVLLVSISAPPKNSPESLQTGRYLKYLSRKHSVTLLTTDPTGGWEPEDQSLLKYLKNVHQIISLYSLPSRLISFLKKIKPDVLLPDEGMYFFWQSRTAIKKIKEKPSIIFSRSAPYSSAIMAKKLAKHWNVPWVMHLSDLWVDSPFFTFSGTTRKKHERLEWECFEQAKIVTLTSQKTIEFYKNKYPQWAHKFRFLPNVFDGEDWNQMPLNTTGKIRFVFTGRLYGTRNIHRLLDAFEKVAVSFPQVEENCEILLAGFFDNENIQRIRRSSLSCVKYLGSLSSDKALQLQQGAHVLISIDSLESDPRYDVFFPSKLLDYIASNRIIIALTNKQSTTYDVVEGKFGKCFYPENMHDLPAEITALVKDFTNGSFKSLVPNSKEISQFEAATNTIELEKILLDTSRAHG